MPAHSSHLLQPLDVGCFAPLKRAYGGLVEKLMPTGVNHIDKYDFLDAFPAARESTFKAETIQNSFAAAGLVPYNPERVLSNLNIQLKTPTPPGSRSTNSAPQTPYNTKQLEKQVSTVKKLLNTRSRSPIPSLEARLNKLIKGYELHLNELILAREELHDLRASNGKQVQKQKCSTRQRHMPEGYTIQEGQEGFQRENEASEVLADQKSSAEQSRLRAPPRCSDCHILGHRRLQCPNRVPS
ncbi:Pogo transposable element [Aspergillus sclerotialis]|uniref:Pogo transposable element n=1 Tax=Aspergillus sclerotialis TaxID=2070753 RepID=A0A3A2ZMK6_9EURO|nr:Pogo transposable element [Aspergillus sclerotialis]